MTKDEMIKRILDVIAPNETAEGITERCPIFEWGHETTPTLEEVTELAGEIADAIAKETTTTPTTRTRLGWITRANGEREPIYGRLEDEKVVYDPPLNLAECDEFELFPMTISISASEES